MINEAELLATIESLQEDALRRWIELGWVLPSLTSDTPRFDDSDVMRVRLICDLHYELHIEEDSLQVILSLLDQLYAARHHVRVLSEAVAAQPHDIRAGINAHLRVAQLKAGGSP